MASISGIKLGLTGLTLAAALFSGLVGARSPIDAPYRVTPIAIAEIPAPGAQTYELIARGDSIPFEKDRTVFGNRERPLAIRHEDMTVSTP